MKETVKGLIDFIKESPDAYHAVATVAKRLDAEGYVRLSEAEDWALVEGGCYYTVRNGTSIVAFRTPKLTAPFMMCQTHSDSPTFKIKESVDRAGAYTSYTTERYGGAILYSWFDRPLAASGRVLVRTECGVEAKLYNSRRPVAAIPSLAIHLNRGVNEGFAPKPAVDLHALSGFKGSKGVVAMVAEELGVKAEDIIGHDLFLSVVDEGKVFGTDNDLILVPRLDDLGCVYCSMEAFLAAKATDAIPVLAVFDNEEVGSSTKQGAASTLLYDTLTRIIPDPTEYKKALAESFSVSADNAHARHPNHPEMSDSENSPTLGGGVVIKYNANQRYATDGLSDALFKSVCQSAGAKTQSYFNRADLPGGSTLGSISDTKVSVPTVDIGLPQLAMHSAVESAAISDLEVMTKALTAFYSSRFFVKGDEVTVKTNKI